MGKVVLLILLVIFSLFVLPSNYLLHDTLAIHENNLTSPTPSTNQNQNVIAQYDIPIASDLPRTLLLDRLFGASDIKLKLAATLDSERQLEQNIDNVTELFLVNEWNPRMSFQFEEGSKVAIQQ